MFCAHRLFERQIRRKTRRISRIVFLLFANHCLNLRNKKSIEGALRQISGSSNQIALSEPTSQIVQLDRSGRTNKSDRPIRSGWQDPLSVSSNQIFATDVLSVSSNQIFATDLLSVLSNQIFPTDLISVSSNQIFPTDLLSISSNQIFPTDLLSVQTNLIYPKDLISVQSNLIGLYGK